MSGFDTFIRQLQAFQAEERQTHTNIVDSILKSMASEPERRERMAAFHLKLDLAQTEITKRAAELKRKPQALGMTAKEALSRFSAIRNGIRDSILAGELSADEASQLENKMNHCVDAIVAGGSAPAQPWEVSQPEPKNPPDRDGMQDVASDGTPRSITENVRPIKLQGAR